MQQLATACNSFSFLSFDVCILSLSENHNEINDLFPLLQAWPGPIVAVFAVYNNSGAGPAVVAMAAEQVLWLWLWL